MKKGQTSLETMFLFAVLLFLLIFMTLISGRNSQRFSQYKSEYDLRKNVFLIADSINIANYSGSGFSQEIILDTKIAGNNCETYFSDKLITFKCGEISKISPVFSLVFNGTHYANSTSTFKLNGGKIYIVAKSNYVEVKNV